MKMMVKDGKYEYVADSHVDSFIKRGYAVADGVAPKPADEVAALKEENAALKEQCDNLSSEFAQAMAANESCAALISSLETANNSLAEENAALKAELESFKKSAEDEKAATKKSK